MITLDDVKHCWYSKIGGLVSSIFSIFFFFSLFSLSLFSEVGFLYKLSIGLLFSMVTYIYWCINVNHISLKDNKINLILSISSEKRGDLTLIENDLISKIKIKYQEDKNINIIVFNPLMINLYKNESKIKKFLSKYSKDYRTVIVKGLVKRREDDNYYIETKAFWNHMKINGNISQEYGMEVGKYFPNLKIPTKEEVNKFHISSNLISLGVDLINIIILEISNENEIAYRNAINLLKDNKIKNLIAIQDIYNHILFNIFKIAQKDYNLFFYQNKEDCILKINKFLEESNYLIENSPPLYWKEALYNMKSIIIFLSTRDIKRVRGVLKKINILQEHKLISEAFLFAYENNVIDCERAYKKLKGLDYFPGIILETEGFISKILEKEPDKYCLFFCLGYLNFFFKKDKDLASEYFSNFIKKNKSKNKKVNARVKKWI